MLPLQKVLYTAKTHTTGGRDGASRTSDGRLDVKLSSPGGPGGGTNPEQLFAIGYAACFESNMRGAARRNQLDPKGTSIKSNVSIIPADEGGNVLGVSFDITCPNIESAEAVADLVRSAYDVCPYSRATRGNVELQVVANGQPVDLSAK